MASVKCSVPGCNKWSFQGKLCKQHYAGPPPTSAPPRVAPIEVISSTAAGTKEQIIRPGYRMSFIKSQFSGAAGAAPPPPPVRNSVAPPANRFGGSALTSAASRSFPPPATATAAAPAPSTSSLNNRSPPPPYEAKNMPVKPTSLHSSPAPPSPKPTAPSSPKPAVPSSPSKIAHGHHHVAAPPSPGSKTVPVSTPPTPSSRVIGPPSSPILKHSTAVASVKGMPASIVEFVKDAPVATTPKTPSAKLSEIIQACTKCWGEGAITDITSFNYVVAFGPKSAVLDNAAKTSLDAFVGWLKTFSEIKVNIKGFTAGAPEKDTVAETQLKDVNGKVVADKNLVDLSQWRAEAVHQRLLSGGISAPFLSHSGSGSSEKGARVELECVLTTRTKQHSPSSKNCDRCKCDCHAQHSQPSLQAEAKYETPRPEPIAVPPPHQTLSVSDATPNHSPKSQHEDELSVHVAPAPAVAGETGIPLALAGRFCRRATPDEVATRTRVERMLATRYVSAPPRAPPPSASCCSCQDSLATIFDQSSPEYEVKNGKLMVTAIAYEPNSAVLQQMSIPIITAVATLLKRNPKVNVHLIGYTAGPAGRDDLALVRDLVDAQGEEVEEACFLELSQWRAEAVCDNLIRLGVDPNRLTFSGAGTDGNGARTEFICVDQYRKQGDWLKGCVCNCHIPKTGKCCSCQEPLASAPVISDEETSMYSVRGGKIYLKRGLLFEPMSAVLDVSSKQDVALLAALLVRFPEAVIDVANYTHTPGIYNDVQLPNMIVDHHAFISSCATMLDLSRWRAESVVRMLVAAGVSQSQFQNIVGKGTDGNGMRTEFTLLNSWTQDRIVGEKISGCVCNCHPGGTSSSSSAGAAATASSAGVVREEQPAGETDEPLVLVGRPRQHASIQEIIERTKIEPKPSLNIAENIPPRQAASSTQCCTCCDETATIPDESNDDIEVSNGIITAKKGITFKPNSALLFPKSFPVVRVVADLLKKHPQVKVHVTGYAGGSAGRDDLVKVRGLINKEGEVEESASFMELSRWRAEMLQSKLVICGVNASQVSCSGAGTDGNGSRAEITITGHSTRSRGDCLEGCVCTCHIPRTGKCCQCQEAIPPSPVLSDEETPVYAVRNGKFYLKRNILFEPMSGMMDISSKQDVSIIAALFTRFPQAIINITNYTDLPDISNEQDLSNQIANQNGIAVSSASVLDLSGYRAESLVDALAACGVELSRFGAVVGKGTDGKGYRTEISVEGVEIPAGRSVGEKIPECECKVCHDESKERTCASETEDPLVLVGRPRKRATRAETKERSQAEPSVPLTTVVPPRASRKAKECCSCRVEEFESIPDVSNADFHVEEGVIFSKKPISFKPNSALLFPKSFPVVRTLAELIKAHPKIKVHITGYAGGPTTRDDLAKVRGLVNQEGEVEEAASFMELSRWRAEMLCTKLILCGIEASQLTFSGAGTDGKGARVELVCGGGNGTRVSGDFFEGCFCACHVPKTGKCCRCQEEPAPLPVVSDEETSLYAIRRGKFYLKKNIAFEPMSAMLDATAKQDVAQLAAVLARFPQAVIHINNFTHAPEIPNDKPLEKQIFDFNGIVVPSASMADLSGYRSDALVDLLVAAGVNPARFGSVVGNGTDGNGARFELVIEGSVPPGRAAGDKVSACLCKCHPAA